MATFQRYYLEDKASHRGDQGPLLPGQEEEAVAQMILKKFGLSPDTGRIINGHTPIRRPKGGPRKSRRPGPGY